MNGKPEVGEFFDIGTVCSIKQSTAMPDGSLKIVLKAEQRCHAIAVLDNEDVRFVRFSNLSDLKGRLSTEDRALIFSLVSKKMIAGEKKLFLLDDLKKIENDSAFILRASEAISAPKDVNPLNRQSTSGLFLTDVYKSEEIHSAVNRELAKIQEVLSETEIQLAFEKVRELFLQS